MDMRVIGRIMPKLGDDSEDQKCTVDHKHVYNMQCRS